MNSFKTRSSEIKWDLGWGHQTVLGHHCLVQASIDDLSYPGMEVSGGTVVSGGNSFYLPNSSFHSTNTKFEYDHSHFTENTGWLAEVR